MELDKDCNNCCIISKNCFQSDASSNKCFLSDASSNHLLLGASNNSYLSCNIRCTKIHDFKGLAFMNIINAQSIRLIHNLIIMPQLLYWRNISIFSYDQKFYLYFRIITIDNGYYYQYTINIHYNK